MSQSLQTATDKFLVERSVVVIPKYLYPRILYFRSNYIFRHVFYKDGLRLERTGGGDDVMGTIDQGVAELTDDTLDCLPWRVLVLREEYIKLSIVQAKTSEVVMAGVAKVQGQEVVLGAKVVEQGRSYCVFGIAVSIASNIYWTLVGRGNFFQEKIKKRES